MIPPKTPLKAQNCNWLHRAAVAIYQWTHRKEITESYARFAQRLAQDPRRELYVQKIALIILKNEDVEVAAQKILELICPKQ
jgi:hypothetical protein